MVMIWSTFIHRFLMRHHLPEHFAFVHHSLSRVLVQNASAPVWAAALNESFVSWGEPRSSEIPLLVNTAYSAEAQIDAQLAYDSISAD